MKNNFCEAVCLAFDAEIIKKLVFSRPTKSDIAKVSARLCTHKGRKIIAFEYFLPGDTVSHKNIERTELEKVLFELLSEYRQANLITSAQDVEWRAGKRSEIVVGVDALKRKLSAERPIFEKAIEALDNKKKRLLSGSEDFLIKLGISDKNGRVHDKKQGKFRQICRFLEHIEDIYEKIPQKDELKIYDLCCGKSYLSFAVYYYLVCVKGRRVQLTGIDLKRDVIDWCNTTAKALGFLGMNFIHNDITNLSQDERADMVISLHACDIATDIVLNAAAKLGAKVILSTPCCHRYLNGKIKNKDLSFVTDYPQIANKLCEAFTDAIRLARLKCYGYEVSAKELTSPENTQKNTLLIAVKNSISEDKSKQYKKEYDRILEYLLGDAKDDYLSNI